MQVGQAFCHKYGASRKEHKTLFCTTLRILAVLVSLWKERFPKKIGDKRAMMTGTLCVPSERQHLRGKAEISRHPMNCHRGAGGIRVCTTQVLGLFGL